MSEFFLARSSSHSTERTRQASIRRPLSAVLLFLCLFGMSFNFRPACVSPRVCVRRAHCRSRHCALSSAHGAKLCTDAQHGGGYDATIVVIGPQDRSDKGRLSIRLPMGPRASRHLPPPFLTVALLARAALDGPNEFWHELVSFGEHIIRPGLRGFPFGTHVYPRSSVYRSVRNGAHLVPL